MNKKAAFTLLFVMFGLISGLSILLIGVAKDKQGASSFIGYNQLSLLNTAQQAENVMLYIDLSAKLSYNEVLKEISAFGGYSECGNFNGYNYHQTETKECYPDNLKSQIISKMRPLFMGYLNRYPIASPPKYSFDLVFADGKMNLVGISNDDLRVQLGGDIGIKKYITEMQKRNILDGSSASGSGAGTGGSSSAAGNSVDNNDVVKTVDDLKNSKVVDTIKNVENGKNIDDVKDVKSNSLTGHATVLFDDLYKKEISGIYEVRPNIAISVFDYNTFILDVKSKSQILVSKCSAADDSDKCVKLEADKNGWELGCNQNEKDVFYDFSYHLELLLESDSKDCLYNFLPLRRNLNFSEGVLKFENVLSHTKYKVKYDGVERLSSLNGNQFNAPNRFDVNLKYEDSHFQNIIANNVDMGTLFRVYKDSSSEIKFITQDEYNGYKRTQSKDMCKIFKTKYRFCAKDGLNNDYKFALTLVDLAPPVLENVSVVNVVDSERRVLISFDKSEVADLSHYLIYYTHDSLVKFESSVLIESNSEILKKKVSLNDIVFDKSGNATYVLNDDIDDNKEYRVGIVAVDKAGNSVDNVKQKFEILKVRSLDNLAPDKLNLLDFKIVGSDIELSVKLPIKNIDGSSVVEDKLNVNLYVSDSCDGLDKLNPYTPVEGVPGANVVFTHPYESSKKYCLVVKDNNDNPKDVKGFVVMVK